MRIVLPLMRVMIAAPLLHAEAQAVPPNSPPTASTSPAPTAIFKNIKTDFRAACNGVTNDAPSFMSFNSWARAQTLPITLTIPSGSVCKFLSTPSNFAVGVKNLVVSGYDARFETSLGSFFLGGFGILQENRTSTLVATVAAGEK